MLLRALADTSAPSPLRAHSAPSAIIPKFSSQKALYIVYAPSQCLERSMVAFTTQSNVTANVGDRQYATQTSRPLGA